MSSDNIDNGTEKEQARQFLTALREASKTTPCNNSACTVSGQNVIMIRLAGRSFVNFVCNDCFAAIDQKEYKTDGIDILMLSQGALEKGVDSEQPKQASEPSGALGNESNQPSGIRSADQTSNLLEMEQTQSAADSRKSLETQPHSPSDQGPHCEPRLEG